MFRPRSRCNVTRRMLLVSMVVGVVLAVLSVPLAVVIEHARHANPPFPEPVIDAWFMEPDRATRVQLHDTLGYRIWNSWDSAHPDKVIEFNPDAELIASDPRPRFARGHDTRPDDDTFVMCLYAGWPFATARGRWWGTSVSEANEFLFEQSLFGVRWTIPIFPVWPGLLANTLVYATGTLALLAVVRLLRTHHRRKRGRCIVCSYELDEGMHICPECGLATTASTA